MSHAVGQRSPRCELVGALDARPRATQTALVPFFLETASVTAGNAVAGRRRRRWRRPARRRGGRRLRLSSGPSMTLRDVAQVRRAGRRTRPTTSSSTSSRAPTNGPATTGMRDVAAVERARGAATRRRRSGRRRHLERREIVRGQRLGVELDAHLARATARRSRSARGPGTGARRAAISSATRRSTASSSRLATRSVSVTIGTSSISTGFTTQPVTPGGTASCADVDAALQLDQRRPRGPRRRRSAR